MPGKYDLLVFDLDGTLFETREDLAASVNYSLRKMGLKELPLETVVQFVGDGAAKLIQRSLGGEATESLCAEALGNFLDHYSRNCTKLTKPYPGVAELIPGLPQSLAVLTNKPEDPTLSILEVSGLGAYFKIIIGGDTAHGRKPDPSGMLSIMSDLCVEPERTLLVGDTSVDVKTAKNAGCDCAGVRYGFRPGDFIKTPPDYLLEEFSELLKVIGGTRNLT